MTIETEIIHKWGIGDDPVFGSGSLKDIQTLCNECDKLRKGNASLRAALADVLRDCHSIWMDTPSVKKAQDVCDRP